MLERSAFPVFRCHVLRTPSDAELVSWLAQRESVLDHRVFHAVLTQLPERYRRCLRHAG